MEEFFFLILMAFVIVCMTSTVGTWATGETLGDNWKCTQIIQKGKEYHHYDKCTQYTYQGE